MSFSFRYRLFASVFVLYSSLCGALDRARPTPNFARVSPALFTTFQVPGAVGTYPTSINDSETVTGYYTEPAGKQGGFVRSADGVIETFQVPGSILTEPVGINSAGEVVGYYELTAGVPHPSHAALTSRSPRSQLLRTHPPPIKLLDRLPSTTPARLWGTILTCPRARGSLCVQRLEQ
jgi:hypothetical protein